MRDKSGGEGWASYTFAAALGAWAGAPPHMGSGARGREGICCQSNGGGASMQGRVQVYNIHCGSGEVSG